MTLEATDMFPTHEVGRQQQYRPHSSVYNVLNYSYEKKTGQNHPELAIHMFGLLGASSVGTGVGEVIVFS